MFYMSVKFKKDSVFKFFIFTDFFCLFLSVTGRCVNILITKVDLSISPFSSAKLCCFIYFEALLLGAHKFMIVLSIEWPLGHYLFLITLFALKATLSDIKISLSALVVFASVLLHQSVLFISVLQKFVKIACLLVIHSHLILFTEIKTYIYIYIF